MNKPISRLVLIILILLPFFGFSQLRISVMNEYAFGADSFYFAGVPYKGAANFKILGKYIGYGKVDSLWQAAGHLWYRRWGNTQDAGLIVGSAGGWGTISGTLSAQTDLQTALNGKQAALSGTGFVKIAGTTISYDNSTYLTGNQSTTWTASTDISGSASGTTSISPSLTVVGIRGASVPALSTGYLKYTGSAWTYDNSSFLTGNQTITLTGNITGSGTTSISTTIGNNVATNAMLTQMAAHTYKGNNTGSTANAADITSTQLTADLNVFTSSLQGLVPSSGGGTTNFLRADGTWAATGGGGTPGGSSGQVQFNNAGAFGGVNQNFWDNSNNKLIVGRNFGTAPAYKSPLTIYQDSTNVTYNDPQLWLVAHNRTNGLVAGTLDHSSYIGFDAIFAGATAQWKTIAGSNTQAIIYKDQANNLIFYLDNNGSANTAYTPTERYRITGNGNMLINTTSDDNANKLQVNGGIKVTGGQTINRTTVADVAYTLLATDYLVSYTTLTATRAVSPPASPATNQQWVIKNETANTSAITFVGTLDGAVNPTLINTAYGTKKLFYNGSAWYSIQ